MTTVSGLQKYTSSRTASKFLTTPLAIQGKFSSDEARWEYVFDYFAKDGKLTIDSFSNALARDASVHAMFGKYASDDHLSTRVILDTLKDWSGFPELYDMFNRGSCYGIFGSPDSAQEFSIQFFRAIGRLATDNPNQQSFSKEEFVKFCREWKKFKSLSQL